jgi:tRNA U38,U39,U40 pseudouridine synthase TruA
VVREQIVPALKKLGYDGVEKPGKAATTTTAAAAGGDGDVEAELRELTYFAQFNVLRDAHAAPESIESLGHLVRAYANLGQLTQFHWHASHKVFKARALLYAERMVEREPRNPSALWHRAYARALIGLHDFAAYCKPREEATTIRTLLEFDWHRDAAGVLVANVKADAFCHSMVRALVGACVAVGQGRLTAAHLAVIRDELERTNEFTVLAARGLTLTEVGYPDNALLAARAEQTRNRRDRE